MNIINLYINIGNTHTTVGFFKTKDINNFEVKRFQTKKIKEDFKSIKQEISKLIKDFGVQKIYISSVVSAMNDKFKDFFNDIKISYKFINYKDTKYVDFSGLYNSYQLGADLVAQMSYISHFFEEAIVVSAGTATVIYHIKDKKPSGINVKPGISISLKALEESTDIQKVELVKTDLNFGLNTNEAVSIGIINSIVYEVERIKNVINNDKCPVICSGGDWKYLKNNNWWYIDNLEILGLYIIAEVE